MAGAEHDALDYYLRSLDLCEAAGSRIEVHLNCIGIAYCTMTTAPRGATALLGFSETVAEDPEDVDAVVTEAIALASEASSFTTYEHRFSNDAGDSTPTRYLYTEEPEPAMSRASYLGPLGFGVLALGAELDEFVHFTDAPEDTGGGNAKEYYLDPGPGSGPLEEPRREWERLLLSMEGVLSEGARTTYEGQGVLPDEYLPQEVSGGEDPPQRRGHHYTGTFAHDFPWLPDRGPMETDFELWISEEGHPIRFVLAGMPDPEVPSEYGEPLTYTHHMDFLRFDEPVEVEVPDESEIHPERP